MKKINIILIICLFITLFPGSIIAKENKQITKKDVLNEVYNAKNPFKNKTKEVNNELDFIKQMMLEDLTYTYVSYIDEYEYEEEIEKALDETYENLKEEINNLKSIDEEKTEKFIKNYGSGLYYLMDLGYLTKDVTNKITAQDLKNKFINQITDYVFQYPNDLEELQLEYNDYYASLVIGLKTESLAKLEEIDSYIDVAKIGSEVELLISQKYHKDFEFDFSADPYENWEDDDWDDDWDDDDWEDEEEKLKEKLNINIPSYLYYIFPDELLTIEEIDELKEDVRIYINNYVDGQLSSPRYDNIPNEVYDIRDQKLEELEDMYNGVEIYNLCLNTIEKLEKVTGIKYQTISSGEYDSYQNKLYKLYKHYSGIDLYTEDAKYEMEEIYNTVICILDSVFMSSEIPSDFLLKVENLYKEIPTANKEYYNLLVSNYKNKARYNQTKVNKLLKQAKNDLNLSTNADEAENIYYEYIEKLDATIYKFKITTLKYGKGTVSKTKTVNYGNSYTVNIKANKGYKIKYIYVDGKKVKKTSKYIFKNIKKNHTLKVYFVKK